MTSGAVSNPSYSQQVFYACQIEDTARGPHMPILHGRGLVVQEMSKMAGRFGE